ncbi:hypothetical protein ABQ433_04845 [Citrobacter freundii]|uniref:hypothetical protein n=1 Tax=Citrobacter freundii TaxID=546 RepID=UPI0015EFA943|nr:hypothetical protein [Citrobacter freundii]QMG40718.1 hypothetical protein HVY60_09050 [Citrobacter freundii]
MPVNSNDILSCADSLIELENETGYRSCVSRAYYASYHHALESLQAVPAFLSNHHSNLIGYMCNKSENKLEPYDSAQMKLLGYNLRQQREARNEADYHISEVTVSKEMAETALASSRLFFQKWNDMKKAIAS